MNGKKAKMLRQLAKILYSQYPSEPQETMYKNLKKAYKNKTGPFREGALS